MLRHQLPVHSPLPLAGLAAASAALATGGDGARTRVESLLRERFGGRSALLTDSGTTALRLALALAARRAPGRPAALPAYCCYDIATAADGAGVPVVLYDLDPRTLGPDAESMARVVGAGVSCVVVAHLYGVPVDLDAARVLASAAGVPLIEDAAQGVGGVWAGRPLGEHGDFSVLSFGRGKGLTGSGGGALLAREGSALTELSATLAPAPRGARAVVAGAAQWLLARPGLYAIPAALPFLQLGETVYRTPTPPRAMAATQAAILSAAWPLQDAETARRRGHATRLLAALPGTLGRVKVPARGEAGWLRLPVVGPGADGGRVGSAASLGVMAGYPRALPDLRGFGARAAAAGERYDGARLLAARLFTLPTHGRLAAGDLERLERWLAGWR